MQALSSWSGAASAVADLPAGCRLEVRGLLKRYGSTTAVDGVDLEIPPGRLLCLLGPSGCGKTTILQSIAGFVTPDAGDVLVDGRSVLAQPPEARATAMLFQHYALFPHMTVRENIAFGPRMQRWPKAQIEQAVQQAMAGVRIADLADRRPHQLSGGQKQRVALARALVTRPKVLLLDEPLGALDQNLRAAMQVELRKLQQRVGITSLIVTHDQKEAIALSDLIAVMNHGRIEQIGTPLDIYDRPRTAFVARFTGVENLLPATVLARHGRSADVRVEGLVVQGVPLPAELPADVALHLAVRAESLEIGPAGSGMAGTVSFARALGASIVYEVATTSGPVLSVSTHRRDDAAYEVGDSVGVRLSAARCALIEAEAA